MSSIVTTVFKFTIGLLVSEGRNKVAKILKDGDVTDQKLYSLIVEEMDNIKSKLDALSSKDLGASISSFAEGIALFYEVFEMANTGGEYGATTAQAACDEALRFIEGIKRLNLTDLDEDAKRKLSTAKKRFKNARKRATEAFHNTGLKISDRILAMKYRVMATILETVDNPTDALAPCKVCVKELNSLPAVQKNFDVQLKTGTKTVRGLFGKEERRKVISSVCHVNRVIYDVTRTFDVNAHFWIWPPVYTRDNKINPLYDARVAKVLLQQGMEHCCVSPCSFGQEGEKEHRLKNPKGIATNSSGEFIVGGYEDRCVKVFDSNGEFVKRSSFPNNDVNTLLYIDDVATDMNDNIFMLTKHRGGSWLVYILTETADLHHTFRLRGEEDSNTKYRGLSVRETGKVVTMRDGRAVEDYDSNGEFLRNYGEGILKFAKDITVANDGRVLVVDSDDDSLLSIFGKEGFFVHIFSEHGEHLNKFKLQRNNYVYRDITFHRASEHVFVAGIGPGRHIQVKIYKKDGEFVCSVQIPNVDEFFEVKGITVNNDGRIAIVTRNFTNDKVVVL